MTFFNHGVIASQTGHAGGLLVAPPTVISPPSLAAQPIVGNSTSYTAGTYTGNPTITRQWLLDGNPIAGATGPTYTPIAGDVGAARLSVRETATNAGGTVQSTTNTVDVSAPPSFTTAPTVNGTPLIGVATSYTPGSATGFPAPTVTQQWVKNGTDIAGATGATYTPLSGDGGANLAVRETLTNWVATTSSTSATKAVATAPTVTAAPVILGTPTVGIPVAYNAGTYTGNPAPTLTRQWLLDGNAITGATNATYTPVSGDVGANRLSVRETATNVAGSVNSTSATATVAGPGASLTTINLTTSASSGTYPFSVGVAFKKGDVPASFVTNLSNYQVVAKRTWNDGSLKHAIISGRAALTQSTNSPLFNNNPLTIAINLGTPPSGTNLTRAQLESAVAAANQNKVQCGAIGTVDLSSILASGFVRTWVQGPEMIECHYRADVGGGTLMSVWFYVRYFVGGRVWVRGICENGYLDNGSGAAAANADRAYVPAVTIGGATVYSNGGASLTHSANTRWSVEGWIGGDPQITPLHNAAYLRASGLVPNYGWTNPSASALDALTQAYTPMSRGDLAVDMGSTGPQPQIGILPTWDALFSSSGDIRAYRSLIANSSHLNSYALTWRDKTTQRFIKPSSFATWNPGGPFAGGWVNSSSVAGTWDNNHHGSGGYLAYLLTGDYWHYETLGLQAAFCWLLHDTSLGQGTSRKLEQQVRGSAWDCRTVGQLCAIAPDSDIGAGTLVEDYRILLNFNYDTWQSNVRDNTRSMSWSGLPRQYNYGAGSGGGGWGFPADPNGFGGIAPWMQHFWTQTNGFVSDIEPLADINKRSLLFLRDWMYRFIVGTLGRAGKSTDFSFTNASNYGIKMSSTNTDAGWYQDWGTVWTQTMGSANTTVTNTLGGSSGGDPANISSGYYGNLQPAIAYAVDHMANGALPSYLRLTNATNWAANANQTGPNGFNDFPVFGIVPRRTLTLPAWASAPALWTWVDVPNSDLSAAPNCVPSPQPAGSPSGRFSEWTGGTVDPANSYFYLTAAGGHNVYAGNETLRLALNQATPAWTMIHSGSAPSAMRDQVEAYQDGRRSATHNYNMVSYLAHTNKIVHAPAPGPLGVGLPAGGLYPDGSGYYQSFDIKNNDWDPLDTLARYTFGGDFTDSFWTMFRTTGDVMSIRAGGPGSYRWNSTTNTWTLLSSNPGYTNSPSYGGQAVDPEYQQVFKAGGRPEWVPNVPRLYGWYTGVDVGVTMSGTSLDDWSAYSGAVYDEANKNFLLFASSSGTVVIRRATRTGPGVNSFNVDSPPTQNTISFADGNGNGPLGKVQYVPALRGVICWNQYGGNVKFMRTWDPGMGA